MLPTLGLEADQVECRIFSDPYSVNLDDLDVLVIVKGLAVQDFELAQRAARRRVPLVLDLCDNIFASGYGQSTAALAPLPGDVFAAIAQSACAVVVSTAPLAELVRQHVANPPSVLVIPDGIEDEQQRSGVAVRLAEAQRQQHRLSLRALFRRARRSVHRAQDFGWLLWEPFQKKLKRAVWQEIPRAIGSAGFKRLQSPVLRRGGAQPARTAPSSRMDTPAAAAPRQILWFGIHGAEHARFGMLDLLLIQSDLEQVAREFDVELVVVSNHRDKYDQHIRPMKIRSRYVEWSEAAMAAQLQTAAVVVIPNSLDAFSVCKSANRTVLALQAGRPVVATPTPALADLSGSIYDGAFVEGMRLYLSDAARARQDVAQGQALIQRHFSVSNIASRWLEVLESARQSRDTRDPMTAWSPGVRLVVALQLIMDIDLTIPILSAARQMGISVLVLCDDRVRSARADIAALLARYCDQHLFVHMTLLDRSFRFPPAAEALLTFSESNLRPHAFNHQLTRMANRVGLPTWTMQHGFENVGLTYDDAIQPIRKVRFEARHVFIWGDRETLHPAIPASTRAKCLPVGCPKPAQGKPAALPDTVPPGQTVIGVFENLHWKRYSDTQRQAFIHHVNALARRHPGVLFLVKPHNAGLWLTRRFQGDLPDQPNILIADPRLPEWESITASGLFWRCAAVITTPSTVALDAARHGLPVALFAEGLTLDQYRPLTLLRGADDWTGFVTASLAQDRRAALEALSNAFCQRTVLPDGADFRMVSAMLERFTAQHTHAGYRQL
ncbi:hypothetical protein [Polaromonas sp. YR568]|uniref:hypothetical protein n=1 Tax=Polaromonas sp. YR568 TaxID=1855301 RepID=UPI00313838F3